MPEATGYDPRPHNDPTPSPDCVKDRTARPQKPPRILSVMGGALSINAYASRLFKAIREAWGGKVAQSEEWDGVIVLPKKAEGINALCRQTHFTKTEIKVMYQGFKQACPSGIVNENTFKDIYAQFFPQGDSALYAHYVFKSIDTDHNGTINFKDFVVGLSILSRGTTDEKLQWIFNLYDINGDGNITQEEMVEIITAIYNMLGDYVKPQTNEETPRQHAERVFQKLDLNQDGVVTWDEFVETCAKDENILLSLQLLDTVL